MGLEAPHAPCAGSRAARWLSFAVLSAVLGCFAVEGSIRIPFRGDVHPPESHSVRYAWSVERGEPLYADFHAGPFTVAVYPPLYFWICGWIGRALRADADGLAVIGRMASSIFALLAAAALAAAAGREARSSPGRRWPPPFQPALAFALALSNPLLLRWALVTRPDTAAIALSALGLWFGARLAGEESDANSRAARACGGPLGLWAGALLSFAAALGMKQTAVAAPAALLLCLLWRGRWRRALGFGLCMAAISVAGLGFLRMVGGPFVFANLFANASVPYRMANWGRPFEYAMRDSLPSILLLGLGAISALKGEDRTAGRPAIGLMGFYLAASFLLALLESGKSGSTMNYYLEFAMAAGVMSERAAAWVFFQREGPVGGPIGRRFPGILKASAGALAALVLLNLWARPYVWHVRRDELGAFRNAPVLVDRLRAEYADKLVLASDAYVALRLGTRPVLFDPFLLSALRAGGGWSPGALHRQIRNREYALLVFDFDLDAPPTRPDGSIGPEFQGIPFWPSDTAKLLRENYRLVRRQQGFYLYAPRA